MVNEYQIDSWMLCIAQSFKTQLYKTVSVDVIKQAYLFMLLSVFCHCLVAEATLLPQIQVLNQVVLTDDTVIRITSTVSVMSC